RVRARDHLRAALQGDQSEAPGLLLRAAAVAAGARRPERARRRRRVAVPDVRPGGRDRVGVADLGLARPARAGDARRRPEDPDRADLLGHVFVRARRAAGDRLERSARGMALGRRLRDRAPELPARRLLPDAQPQFLIWKSGNLEMWKSEDPAGDFQISTFQDFHML